MKMLAGHIRRFSSDALDVILPPRCAISGDLVEAQGMISPESWRELTFLAAPFCAHCGIPFEYEDADGDGVKCMSCLLDPPVYDSARSALVYDDMSRDLVLGFKHGDKTHMALSFVPWMKRAGGDMLDRADILVPVPLHPFRLIARRFNQSALIAHHLSKASGIEHEPRMLVRTRSTVMQGTLSRHDRAENVRGAFDVSPKRRSRIDGKVVILVDDVYTTGATVLECAKVLKAHGAAEVHVLTVARTVYRGA